MNTAVPINTTTNTPGLWGMSRKLVAIGVAVAIHALLALIALMVVFLPPLFREPEIVAQVIGPVDQNQDMQRKKVVQHVQHQTVVNAAAPMAVLVRAQTAADFSVPDVAVAPKAIGLGEGDLGAFIGTPNLGEGASFFGAKSKGNRVVFILDVSGSMNGKQRDLIVSEMEKSLRALKPNMQYQVILFAGVACFAEPGFERTVNGKIRSVIDPRGKKYDFECIKPWNFKFLGTDDQLPSASWLPATAQNIEATLKVLNKKYFWPGGTDWRWPFRIAMNMNPPPEAINFLTDGHGGAGADEILAYNRRNPKTQINGFALNTMGSPKEFDKLAKETGGTYSLVLNSGEAINCDELFARPERFTDQLQANGVKFQPMR